MQPSGEIKGLTDRPRLPRLGKIRLGVKKPNASGRGEHPQAVDYFVCPPEVIAIYGEKPRELDVIFPVDDVAQVAGASYKMYTATRGKVCTSDGETAYRLIDDDVLGENDSPTQDQLDRALVKPETKNFSRRAIPCPNSACRFFQDNQCRVVLNLTFLLPKVPGLGCYQLDSGSYNSIVDVRGGMELVKRITGGRIAGIPLKLRIKATTAYPEGKKKNVFTLEVVSMEKLEAVAALGEGTLHDILLPLTEGRMPPSPLEPEEEFFVENKTDQRGSRVIDVVPAGVAQSVGSVPPEKERGRPTVEVAGSTPAPRSDTESQFATAARIEQLFGLLSVTPKDRETWRHLYRGRDAKLVTYLEGELEKKRPKP